MTSVIVFGATGFLGEPICKTLAADHPDWIITAYVRPRKATPNVQSTLGVSRIVEGTFDEFDKIAELCKTHDMAINAGNSFTAEPVAAIVAGLKAKTGGVKGKLIHISGAGNFIDQGTSGQFNPDSKVWNDNSEEDIRAIHKDMFNGPSDTVVLDAGADGSVDTYIVCVPVVYGGASIGLPGIGVGYNLILGNAIPLGFVPFVGDGSAVLTTIHIMDAVPFICQITESAAMQPAQGNAFSRFYMIETERVSWKALATELAKVLHGRGVLPSELPKSVAIEDAGHGEVKYLVGSNMLMKGDRAARLGFKPSQPSILQQMHDDLKEAVLPGM